MNKLGTHRVLKAFISKKRVITMKIANNTAKYFRNDVFESQGGVFGSRWEQSERSKKDGGLTLQKTGKGKRSIEAKVVSDTKAYIRARQTYMNYHQTGAGNNPKREFMDTNAYLLGQNAAIIEKELRKL